jgi:hypothetical protein
MIVTKEEMEEAIHAARDVETIATAMDSLGDMRHDFAALIDEVQAQGGEGAWEEADADDVLTRRLVQWLWALACLGFDADAEPTAAEITKAYRRAAMAYHPDRHQHEPQDVQEQYEQLFKEASEARDILEQGRPLAAASAEKG